MDVPPGRFVVIEGLDGAGTTTQAGRLATWLREERGVDVVLTGEPTDGPVGKLVRHLIDTHQPVDGRTLALLFAADRNEHLFGAEGIVPALAAGRWVVCDRYLLSGLAYQAADGVPVEELLQINGFAPDPDLTVYVDVTPEAGLERVSSRGTSSSRYETVDRLAVVRRWYRDIKAAGHGLGRLEVVDGTAPIDDVTRAVTAAVDRALPRDGVA